MQGFEFLDKEAFFNFAANPELTQDAFKVQTTLVKHPNRSKMIQWSEKAILNNPEFMDMYHRKYLPTFPTLEQLDACPQGSLGKRFARHLIDNNIQLNFEGLDTSMFYSQDVNHMNYMAVRNTRNHDIYHVLYGLGTSPMDEYRLFSVQLAQFASPYHFVLLTSGCLHIVFHQPDLIPELLESNYRYYEMGKKSKFLLSFPYEEHWNTDLNEVRKMLNIDINNV